MVNENSISDDYFQCVSPITKEQFHGLYTFCDAILIEGGSRHVKKIGLLAFLCNIRHGLSDEFINLLFRFVSENIGFGAITHENFIAAHVPAFANILHNDTPNITRVIAYIDGTYPYVPKSCNFRILRQTFSAHKHRYLIKPVSVVAPGGYIVAIQGPYFADARNNDALSLSVGSSSFLPRMPMHPIRKSIFKFFEHLIAIYYIDHLGDFYRIAGALFIRAPAMRYHPLIEMEDCNANLVNAMLIKANEVNVVKARVEKFGLGNRMVRLDAAELADFPHLDFGYLKEITCGRMDQTNKTLFSWIDYGIFGSMLSGSVVMGVYFACTRKERDTVDDYFQGGKTMKVLPIGLSLIASEIGINTLLAAPVEIYRFGANYVWLIASTMIECFIGYHLFLKVFFKLQISSVYEYLHLRFDKKLALMTSFLNLLQLLFLCSLVTYVPSLAFAQVSGANIILTAIVTSSLCIFYTTIGGFKAVVWSDMLQLFIMVASFLVILCTGISAINGFDVLWDTSIKGHRLDIFDFDPTLRDSFSSVLIGGTFYWLSLTVQPNGVQKFLSVPNPGDVKKVAAIFAGGVALIHVLAVLTGLLLYTKYWNCDPIISKQISTYDQLVPFFVMDISGKLVGYPGIFVAGVFSAGLSTLSATLNTMSAVIYEDFVSRFVPNHFLQRRRSALLKSIVMVCGLLSIFLVFVLQEAEGIFPLFVGLTSISVGPTLGLFVLGVLIPMANSKGACYGGFVGIISSSYIFIQNQRNSTDYLFLKPISAEGCNSTFYHDTTLIKVDLPFFLHRISFWYNTLIGSTVTVVVGVVVSCCTKHDKVKISKDLFCPLIHRFIQNQEEDRNQTELTLLKSESNECSNKI
ncbi:hypothetical protein FQR65_LT12724 [Abscondita terminalis]|nr:hypothetical protein FQR65_LT12724 [Abscondita terminalis]